MDSYIFAAVALIFLLGTFVQASIGFGLALVAMPILVSLLSIHVAAPLVALVAAIGEIVILLRYRDAFMFRNIKQLMIAAVAGIPIGILAVRAVDGDIVIKLLGVIVRREFPACPTSPQDVLYLGALIGHGLCALRS